MSDDTSQPNAGGFRSLVEQIQKNGAPVEAPVTPRRRPPQRRGATDAADTPVRPKSAPVRLLSRRWL